MSALSIHLERLLRLLESIGLHPPSQEVRIIEVNTDGFTCIDGKEQIRKEGLRTPSEYEDKFDELLKTGYGWLNLSCYGVYEGVMIVAVEVPSATGAHMTPSGWSPEGRPRTLHPGCATSVHLSGPARIVLEHERSVDSILTMV